MNEGELLYQGEPKLPGHTNHGRTRFDDQSTRGQPQTVANAPYRRAGQRRHDSVSDPSKRGHDQTIFAMPTGCRNNINETTPRFEDAFIDLLVVPEPQNRR